MRGMDYREVARRFAEDVKKRLGYGVYVSAKVLSVEEFELMKNLNTAFYRNIQREGVLIG
ncbi:hypothetical protein [Thermococcus pacificus]|uniref:hypothetical protein n=1 Tax=Thermococcus pacificus TaxID=71998 RepID=UPI0012FD7EB2|nr:hypothetical protein [Thermococcus pacificus]